jgi:plastocyanin
VSTPPADPGGATPGEQPPAPAAASPAAPDRCPRCGTPLAPGQYWCLACGFAARTQVATAPRWRWPIVALALAGALAFAGVVYGFVKLSEETGKAPATGSSGPTGPTIVIPAVPTGPTQPAPAPAATGPTGPAAGPTAATGPTGPTAPASGANTAVPRTAFSTVSLAADLGGAIRYDKASLRARAGKVTIDFADRSPIPHNVTVSAGARTLGATKTITASTAKVTLTLKAGTYTYYCSVDAHRAAGMQGTLVIR